MTLAAGLLSFLKAIPAAWFLAEQGLQNYAHRVPNGDEQLSAGGDHHNRSVGAGGKL
ncbi:MAG: hypothetical protein WEA56_16480 [Balneolaceae bacterium]